jgi:hypothetical protein
MDNKLLPHLKKNMGIILKNHYFFEDFTEKNYQRLLQIAKKTFCFNFFGEANNNSKNILLRHDIDHSVERAVILARIEAEEKIKSTYFIYLHSEMYSIFEKETLLQLKEILSLGFKFGLHFDGSFYCMKNENEIMNNITFEREILEKLLNTNIEVISFHAPQFENSLVNIRQESFCGMINAYAESIRNNYEYISDSNGYWRFKRLEEVLLVSPNNLHILIHPIWWAPLPIAPRERIQRCIDKRSARMGEIYDCFTEKSKRLNIVN